MTLSRAHVYISGRVQGVFYRSSTRKQAHVRGLTGYTRNLPDGRVEAVFEGEKKLVEEMIEWSRKGPEFASVEDVEVQWETPLPGGQYSSFDIIY